MSDVSGLMQRTGERRESGEVAGEYGNIIRRTCGSTNDTDDSITCQSKQQRTC